MKGDFEGKVRRVMVLYGIVWVSFVIAAVLFALFGEISVFFKVCVICMPTLLMLLSLILVRRWLSAIREEELILEESYPCDINCDGKHYVFKSDKSAEVCREIFRMNRINGKFQNYFKWLYYFWR